MKSYYSRWISTNLRLSIITKPIRLSWQHLGKRENKNWIFLMYATEIFSYSPCPRYNPFPSVPSYSCQ